MELDPKSARITRAEKVNPKEVFFIINEAIISKLCILGQETEPCFEGADIKAPQIQFSFEEDFKTRFFSMMEELKTIMSKGGETMSEVVLENEIVEEETEVVLENEVVEEEEIVTEEEVIETQDNSDETDSNNFEKNTEDDEEEEEEICPDCGKPVSECICKKYEALQQDYETLQSNYSALETEVVGLREFKASAERKEKTELINSFYMLSEEDKADVVTNIDNYSLEDIEGKLSIICVRNKVSFSEESTEDKGISYNLNDTQEDELMPAWVKAAKAVRDSK